MKMRTAYGAIDLTRMDIRDRAGWSLDLRDLFGGDNPDASAIKPAGTFVLSVLACGPDEVPIGEILILHRDVEVSIVGHPTGRPGVIEITPEHLLSAHGDASYRGSLIAWIESAA